MAEKRKVKAKGRSAGVPNYKNEILINVVEAILPDGALGWTKVAQRYQEASGEKELRDSHDIKRHFTTHKSLCDSGKKVTGSSAPTPSVARCQAIWQKILRQSSAKNCGGSGSDSDSDDDDDENSGDDSRGNERNSIDEEEEIFGDNDYEDFNEINEQYPLDDPVVAQRDPSPVLHRPLVAQREKPNIPRAKRGNDRESEERGKSKNCRNNPRGSAGAALTNLADAYTQKQLAGANEPSMAQVMMMQMQQHQQQQQQQQQQQNQ